MPPKGPKLSKESRKKISDANKGKISPWKGQHHSEETKNKLRLSHLGRHHTPEAIEKIRRSSQKRLIQKPTKPQSKLLENIKIRYPNEEVMMEYSVKNPDGKFFFIDVAIPRLWLGFEWDEPAFHGGFRGSKEKDMIRHKLIEAEGWELTHYHDILEFPE